MNWLRQLLLDEQGGLYINLASVVSVVCDDTGDDTQDAQVKVRRLVNKHGPGFCMITNWPFMRSDISFSITNALGSKYSGASYLPEAFRKVVGANIVDSNNKWYPLDEVDIKERYERWLNPSDNTGRPTQFCITRIESGYYEIEFDKVPDQTYTFKSDIELKWTPATATTANLVVTDDYMEVFCHYISMQRARQQGDLELYGVMKDDWYNPDNSAGTVLGRALANLSNPLKVLQFTPPEPQAAPDDYTDKGWNA